MGGVWTIAVRKTQRYPQRDFVVMGDKDQCKKRQNKILINCDKKIKAGPSPDKVVRKGFSKEGTLSPPTHDRVSGGGWM